ncbi:MAG: TRAP transporter small permease subunit [Rubrivivax sp.]|nr:TRAP transporter small permease subunit [Rubrivivax sp.]
MRQLMDAVYRGLMFLSGLSMLTAFLAVMAGIADRQMAWGLRGLDAYAGYAIAAALFLALPQTLQRGEHIRVSLLVQRLPAVWRGVLEWWSLGAALALSGALAFYALRLVWVSYTTHDVSQGSDATPLWIPQIAMALGCIGLALAFADALVSRAVGAAFFREAAPGEAARVE